MCRWSAILIILVLSAILVAADKEGDSNDWLGPIKGLFRFLNKNKPSPSPPVGKVESTPELVDLSDDRILQLLEQAKAKIMDGKLADSLDDLLQVISARPDHHVAHSIAGGVLLSLGQYDLAETMLYSASRLSNWSDFKSIANLASTLRVKGDNDLALKTLLKALQQSRQSEGDSDVNGVLSAGLAETYYELKDYSTAADWYLATAMKNPADTDSWIKASTIRYPAPHQDMKFAENVLLQGIAANPNNAELIYHLALTMYASNKVDQAIALFEQSLRLNPKHYDSAAGLATAYHSIDKLEEALYYYDATLANTPNNVVLLSNYAMLLNSINRKEDAFTLIRRAFTLKPSSAEVLRALNEIGIDPKSLQT